MHTKSFVFFFLQGIALCNYGGWLSKTEVSGTGRQERKIPSRVRAHEHSLKLIIQWKQGRKFRGEGSIIKDPYTVSASLLKDF